MSNTTITTSNADLSALFRPGDAVRLMPDADWMGTKVIVRVHATWLEVRDVRWYDRVRWFVRGTIERIRLRIESWLWRVFP